jgi:hypothetical protein
LAVTAPGAERERGRWRKTARLNRDDSDRLPGANVLLPNGKVLAMPSSGDSRILSEVYDPVGETWTTAAEPPERTQAVQFATLITGSPSQCGANCGKVLVRTTLYPTYTALYDPVRDEWTRPPPAIFTRNSAGKAAPIRGPRCGLHCGKILVTGGSFNGQLTAELYDPSIGPAGAWLLTDFPKPCLSG